MKLAEFIAKWQGVAQKERSVAQSHFLDLCELLDQPKPTDVDPEGTWYCFEYGATKGSGGEGWADVFKKSYFGWEYKGKHKDLGTAYRQLQDYRVSLLNPPLLIVCDLERFRIHTNFVNSPEGRYEFDLSTLAGKSNVKPEYTNFEILRFAFTEPDILRVGVDPLKVTQQAAENLCEIADRMSKRVGRMEAAHFVMKLIFCLFAEDIKPLPGKLLSEILKKDPAQPGSPWHNRHIANLIHKMDTGGEFGLETIPEFNGGLFDGSEPIPLENGEIKVLKQAAKLDWRYIEPSVFGTLLERAFEKPELRKLGAHYTAYGDIMKVIEPVVLSPLREEWIALRAEFERPGAGLTAKTRTKRIEAFLASLCNLRILDPACGSGNFLYVALHAVMDLEEEVRAYAHKHKISVLFSERVGPEILMGREIDAYAKELASTVIWIGYIQKRMKTGSYEERPVLRPLENIVLGDSILTDDGKMPDWRECDCIVGNPPFLGHYRMRDALGEQYCDKLYASYEGILEGKADLCCCFHEQARRHLEKGRAKRAGLLATNSIRFGDSRRVLDRISKGTGIFHAWSDLEWPLEGANVRISIICHSHPDQEHSARVLDGQEVPTINSDLTSGVNLTSVVRLAEIRGLCFVGDQKTGKFDLSEEQARRMLGAAGNPNGRPNSDVIRRWANGRDLLYPLWRKKYIIDFGADMPQEEAAQYVLPFGWVKEHVYPTRQRSRNRAFRERWWIHQIPRISMRKALEGFEKYLATVRHTHSRVFRFVDTSALPDSALIVFAIDDWYRFGVLQSRAHEHWTLGLASDLRGWTRYTPTTVFNTFSFPRISPHLRERYPLEGNPISIPGGEPGETRVLTKNEADVLIHAVEVAAEELYEQRDNVVFNDPDCPSYTELYKRSPPWLQMAHKKLDDAVLACYGLPATATKHDILEYLLAENLARAESNA
ncbi:class I SAM-dependent DNA methyltransferase [bacterium]|nr:class I SAM-dependent DNA methyltransferase [bacterium]